MENNLNDLPENVRIGIGKFADAAKGACGDNLVSIVLFGSAAEGRLRPTSDVNLILVLKEFQVAQIDTLREDLRLAHAAIRLGVMFLLASEIPAATEAFAVKFADILDRHRVIHGADPFANLEVSRAATVQRLKQVLVNLTLRLRERYALISLREEKLAPVIAEASGPIRASAATILRLEGKAGIHPKEALQEIVRRIPGKEWDAVLKNISAVREEADLPPGAAASTVLGLLDLLKGMYALVLGLK